MKKTPKLTIEDHARLRVRAAGIEELSEQSDVFEAARKQFELRSVQVPPKGTELSIPDLIRLLRVHNRGISDERAVHIARRFDDHLTAGRKYCALRSLLREMGGAPMMVPTATHSAAQHAH